MRTLNCKRAARMISLYVAGDLVGAPEREVAAHLAACEGCRQLAEVFAESSSLLIHAGTPPEFGAEFYSGIRCAVLSEITRDRIKSKPSLFRPRWLYATAFAAIVIVSGLMLQPFVGTRRGVPQDLARAPQVTVQPTSGSTEVPSPGKQRELAGTQSAQASKDRAPANPRGSSRRFAGMRKSDALVTSQASLVNNAQIAQAVQSSAGVGTNGAESVASVGGPSSSSSERASTSEVSRIEIQTADPNIRIIWLSPRESGEPDGTKHDQDHPETSNRK
jgi:Putative zinc-finger